MFVNIMQKVVSMITSRRNQLVTSFGVIAGLFIDKILIPMQDFVLGLPVENQENAALVYLGGVFVVSVVLVYKSADIVKELIKQYLETPPDIKNSR